MQTYECIAAFLDNEPFDAEELRRSLATEEGRAFLIDSLALRDLVQPGAAAIPSATPRRRASRWLAAAAAMTLCCAGSYWAGLRTSDREASAVVATPAAAAAPMPAPSRIIRLEPGVTWHETGGN
jgi:hypothetical protein